MPYPFNITMRPETLAKVIFDALESCIVQGIDRLLIVNGHGGNNSAIDVALTWLRREHPRGESGSLVCLVDIRASPLPSGDVRPRKRPGPRRRSRNRCRARNRA